MYIYIYVCACVCVFVKRDETRSDLDSNVAWKSRRPDNELFRYD